jgi:hypothetical protein
MRPAVSLSRQELDDLLSQHRQVIRLMNDLEYCLYRIGESDHPAAHECRQAAGALIGCLRDLLFRQDQQVFPLLEVVADSASRRA